MPFSTLGLSAATAGTATLAFAIAAQASAQEPYAHTHYAHTHYHHYHHYADYGEGRQIIIHSQQPVQVQTYARGPVGAVSSVVGGTGQAVGAVFYGGWRHRGRGRWRRLWRRVGALRRSGLQLCPG